LEYLENYLKQGGCLIKSNYLKAFLSLLLLIMGNSVFANKILYKNGSYVFTQKNATELIELAEFLGRSRLSTKDKKALRTWSILDFKSAPKIATHYYKDLHNNLLPKIRKLKNNQKRNNFRTDLFLSYVDLFNKHPEYKKFPNNFLAVIDRYNPPVQEALLLQQFRFNQVQQVLQLNQMMFNQSMRIQQQSADNMNKSIRDLGARQSISLSGGTILYETKDRIYAKDNKGRKYDIAR